MKFIRLTTILFILIAFGIRCVKNRTDGIHPPPQLPEIDFSWAGDLSAPASVNFINKSRYADGDQWNFGNGQMSRKEHPEEILFDSAGLYKVVLRGEQGGMLYGRLKLLRS